MLIKSLKLPGNERLSNIFVAICGIMTALLSIFKMISQRPRILTVNSKTVDKN